MDKKNNKKGRENVKTTAGSKERLMVERETERKKEREQEQEKRKSKNEKMCKIKRREREEDKDDLEHEQGSLTLSAPSSLVCIPNSAAMASDTSPIPIPARCNGVFKPSL